MKGIENTPENVMESVQYELGLIASSLSGISTAVQESSSLDDERLYCILSLIANYTETVYNRSCGYEKESFTVCKGVSENGN